MPCVWWMHARRECVHRQQRLASLRAAGTTSPIQADRRSPPASFPPPNFWQLRSIHAARRGWYREDQQAPLRHSKTHQPRSPGRSCTWSRGVRRAERPGRLHRRPLSLTSPVSASHSSFRGPSRLQPQSQPPPVRPPPPPLELSANQAAINDTPTKLRSTTKNRESKDSFFFPHGPATSLTSATFEGRQKWRFSLRELALSGGCAQETPRFLEQIGAEGHS